MAFSSSITQDVVQVGAGERWGSQNIILAEKDYVDGLKVGRFAQYKAGELTNLDGTASPVIAGVVLRNVASPIEYGAVFNKELVQQANYLRVGLTTVDVKDGETPTKFGAVYADNATGEATATDTDIATGAEFIQEVKDGVWLILQK